MGLLRTALFAILLAMLPDGAARAEAPIGSREAQQHPELYAALYGFSVCEYCGLVTYEVYDGFHRETAQLIDAGGLDEEVVRKVRMRAWTDADLEYGNRGLGGFRGWCRTEGAAAAQRFIDFRAAQIATEASEGD